MKTVNIQTSCKKIPADLYTPVSIYLRIRDRFPGSILLESADHNAGKNSLTYIAIKPIAGMEIKTQELEYKFPGEKEIKESLTDAKGIADKLNAFISCFKAKKSSPVPAAQSFFGYTAYDAIHFFDGISLKKNPVKNPRIPLLRYRLYQYVIAIDHFKDELYLCENNIDGMQSERDEIETLIRIKDSPSYSFSASRAETSNLSDEEFRRLVQKGIEDCQENRLSQIVLSRSYAQAFKGDEFNVYRALRSINPSPYLFFFDYNDYKIMGSSPESQIVIEDQLAKLSPIAGTVKRTGDDEIDQKAIADLLRDPKENSEHDMLVDAARKELKKVATQVEITEFRKVHSYSHVIHLVSEVTGKLADSFNPFEIMALSFPAGTLSGAPKKEAIQLIEEYEPTPRGFYGGCIGLVGLDGSFNHAIMIRSFLSKNNTLHYQAGAGVVKQSVPENELQEVNNKLRALKTALDLANEF